MLKLPFCKLWFIIDYIFFVRCVTFSQFFSFASKNICAEAWGVLFTLYGMQDEGALECKIHAAQCCYPIDLFIFTDWSQHVCLYLRKAGKTLMFEQCFCVCFSTTITAMPRFLFPSLFKFIPNKITTFGYATKTYVSIFIKHIYFNLLLYNMIGVYRCVHDWRCVYQK